MIATFYAAALTNLYVMLSIYVIKAHHAYGLGMAEASEPSNLKYRIFGMKCIFVALASATVILLAQVFSKMISGTQLYDHS